MDLYSRLKKISATLRDMDFNVVRFECTNEVFKRVSWRGSGQLLLKAEDRHVPVEVRGDVDDGWRFVTRSDILGGMSRRVRIVSPNDVERMLELSDE